MDFTEQSGINGVPCCGESLVLHKVQDVFEYWVALLDRGGHVGFLHGTKGQEAKA